MYIVLVNCAGWAYWEAGCESRVILSLQTQTVCLTVFSKVLCLGVVWLPRYPPAMWQKGKIQAKSESVVSLRTVRK